MCAKNKYPLVISKCDALKSFLVSNIARIDFFLLPISCSLKRLTISLGHIISHHGVCTGA